MNAFQRPPYTITEKAADCLAKIVEMTMRLELGTGFKRDIRLHRENRVRTIHSSLAIEGNSLTLGEVKAVIDGKVVVGKRAEIKEVMNAYEAYDRLMILNPYSIDDFLKAHLLMTQGLVKDAGKFRSGDVGVFDGDVPVHIGARPQFVPNLMEELLAWAKESGLHPVLKSAVVHYEIETIHPFADGNGRMGRLWQTLLLARWNDVFAWIPMESVLYQNRLQYYRAIEDSRKANDSGVFIEFTLSALYSVMADQVRHQDEHQDEHQDKHQVGHRVELSARQIDVLRLLAGKSMSRKEIFAGIGLAGDSRSFKRHLEPLLAENLIGRTIPDKPSSRFQRYHLTESGKDALKGASVSD